MAIAVRALLVLSVLALNVLSNDAWAVCISPTAVGCARGAPGPVAGAGLAVVLVVGYGAYWLAKRNRKQSRD